jgi:hypothetical protein
VKTINFYENGVQITPSTYSTSSELSNGPVKKAFDNDDSTHWSSNYHDGNKGFTNFPTEAIWIQAVFPEAVRIDGVGLLQYSGCGSSKIRLQFKDSTDAWKDATDVTINYSGKANKVFATCDSGYIWNPASLPCVTADNCCTMKAKCSSLLPLAGKFIKDDNKECVGDPCVDSDQ